MTLDLFKIYLEKGSEGIRSEIHQFFENRKDDPLQACKDLRE